ncbi:RHS repeat-associated core domain-containing protein [Gloeobacter morelensis]|uniref:RHS repeat-associated core domain-containing protein n=1 Tax=Gloeobacter morelensis MG652769 TaxID=2781736 RepID=A0ABY3PS26_9CYAN|nr:RHS repeat-associated core domain-containing protein [Gloeobacter morelensis]UFP96417.1 RHS repeat-associated core domain-containing protein [Gloeobacter morelensis MG652769]
MPFGKGFATHSAATQNPILFAGAEANESGSVIHYLRGRYYSAALGRFLAEDPIGLSGGDTNLYRYVFNRPHVDYDPTGLGGGVPTFSVGISEGYVSPFVESIVLGPGERFALQATLQAGVGAVGTRGYLGDPEDVSVNPVGGVPSDLVTQTGNFGSYRVVNDLVAQVGSFGSYRGEGACGNYAFSSIYCSDSLNPEQAKNLGRFNKSLPRNAGATKIYNLPNGGKAFQATSPARNIPGSYAIYEKQIDAIGRTLNYTITTIAPNGSVVKIATKFPKNVPPVYPNR